MKIKMDAPSCTFGALKISGFLQAFANEIDGVRFNQDIECIHRMRVASRRLRSAIPLFHSCFPAKKVADWSKKIKTVTGSLGLARDLDVQINTLQKFFDETPIHKYHPGIRRLMVRLKQKRTAQQEKVILILDQVEDWKLISEIQEALDSKTCLSDSNTFSASFPLYYLSYLSIEFQMKNFLHYREAILDPQNIQEIHALRIEAKRLRYIMETFSAIYTDDFKYFIRSVKEVQEITGNIHDSDVWCEFLPAFMVKESKKSLKFYDSEKPFQFILPGILHFMQNRQSIRQQLYESFITLWQDFEKKNLWDQLISMVSSPIQPVINSQTSPDSSVTMQEKMDNNTQLDKNSLGE